jgi:hypothetical protein
MAPQSAALVGSTTWVEFAGTSVSRKVWDGRADLEEFEADSPAGGHIEGLTLRLYDPQTHQWSLYLATSKSGATGPPTIGEFKDGRDEFLDTEPPGSNGGAILVRFVWSDITPNSAHFEQSFSDDGGKTRHGCKVNLTRRTELRRIPIEDRTTGPFRNRRHRCRSCACKASSKPLSISVTCRPSSPGSINGLGTPAFCRAALPAKSK